MIRDFERNMKITSIFLPQLAILMFAIHHHLASLNEPFGLGIYLFFTMFLGIGFTMFSFGFGIPTLMFYLEKKKIKRWLKIE